ncbi:Shedu immune nuclease family protein [Aquibium carbonis]|uniref:Shedu immune nuclease family protein n=1 Tax=Aquibium carbonis TaxID=2495581 RepID=UPI001AECACED|nr:Shedu immune nuclease family protein [Aquibium carbonis]
MWEDLKKKGAVPITGVFYFEKADLLDPPTDTTDFGKYEYVFNFAEIDGTYMRIAGRKLGIDNDVFMPVGTKWERKLFAAYRNISIFGRLSELLETTDPIYVGGTHPSAIPIDVFKDLLKRFPSTGEITRYAGARVHTILAGYVDGLKDAQGRYETYLNKKMSGSKSAKIDLEFLKELEIEKYIIIRDHIKEALEKKTKLSEGEWQKMMISFLPLLFPKYIKVLENVTINDYYSDSTKKTSRYIDIALVDANGNIDVIEVKKPFDDKILQKSKYRGNSIPTSELSGSIMQAEKYLFHLSKWGVAGEKALTTEYSTHLPPGMKIRIANPKAIIIVGRDQISGAAMTDGHLLDFEVIKRQYANMMDIITYDDLLRRLDNTIVALGGATVITKPSP